MSLQFIFSVNFFLSRIWGVIYEYSQATAVFTVGLVKVFLTVFYFVGIWRQILKGFLFMYFSFTHSS